MGNTIDRVRLRGTALSKLTDKRRVFVLEYLSNGMRGKEAAQVAGYAVPAVAACKLLKNKQVSSAIQKLGTELLDKKEFTAEQVIEQIRTILEFNVMKHVRRASKGGYLVVDEESYTELAEVIGHCISEVELSERETKEGDIVREFKLKLMSKDKALQLACQYFGILNDSSIAQTIVNINWDDMYTRSNIKEQDRLEQIIEAEGRPIE